MKLVSRIINKTDQYVFENYINLIDINLQNKISKPLNYNCAIARNFMNFDDEYYMRLIENCQTATD